jgi:hypothetical protein
MTGELLPETFLQSWAKLVVLIHGGAAIVLIGASTRHTIALTRCLMGHDTLRVARRTAAVTAALYTVTLALGALAYPTYRYWVRGLYLDRYAHWASNLFDMKENIASLGLPLALGAFALSRVVQHKDEHAMLWGYAVVSFGTCFAVWFNVIAGLLVTIEKGV